MTPRPAVRAPRHQTVAAQVVARFKECQPQGKITSEAKPSSRMGHRLCSLLRGRNDPAIARSVSATTTLRLAGRRRRPLCHHPVRA